jgi:amidase
MSIFPEFHKYDGVGIAELVHTKQISPTELVEEVISRIETHNPKINAVIYKMYDQARKIAQGTLPNGPFKGVPFLLKDMHATVEGVPTSCGTRMLKDIPQPHDSEIVRRYRAAGVIFLGKTNVPEFALLPYTEPETFGPTNNPWDLTRTVGGSGCHRWA